jgi:DNA (cytosine-5)-methyltransferase 1
MQNMTYKLGSLFDGSGGFPLSGALCGIEPCWAAEVEPYPIAVTRTRFPNMEHLGDISKINGAEIEPVDIITFGSPCQDLSVAGKRAGLKHEANGDEETTRSGLFMEAVRIIKEMREATNGQYPRWALWENVPGAFSSNNGNDFRVVCEELIKIVEPSAFMPPVPKNGWAYADSYVGDGWSLAYRTFDAQYWGVPQRRRRIHLVADFRGERAREVLFERQGVRGYFETGRTPWQGVACDAEDCAGAADREGEGNCLTPWDVQSRRVYTPDGSWPTLYGGEGGGHGYVAIPSDGGRGLDAVGFDTYNMLPTGDKTVILRVGSEHNYAPVFVPMAYSFDSLASNSMKSSNPHSGCRQVEVAKTLDTTDPNPCKNQGGIAIVEQIVLDDQGGPIPIHDQATRFSGKRGDKSDGKGNGLGIGEAGDPMNTLTSGDRHAVAYLASGKDTVGTLMANAGTKLWLGNQEAFSGDYHIIEEKDIQYIVRRLTPTECARLQGFADRHGDIEKKDSLTPEEFRFWHEVRNTHATINGKKVQDYTEAQMLSWYNKLHTDSAEYKMWGNGIALPPALYCMQGIVDAMNKEEDEEAWLL